MTFCWAASRWCMALVGLLCSSARQLLPAHRCGPVEENIILARSNLAKMNSKQPMEPQRSDVGSTLLGVDPASVTHSGHFGSSVLRRVFLLCFPSRSMVRKGWTQMEVPSGWVQILWGPRPPSQQWPKRFDAPSTQLLRQSRQGRRHFLANL